MDYYNKYLKYKLKYIKLREQIGSNEETKNKCIKCEKSKITNSKKLNKSNESTTTFNKISLNDLRIQFNIYNANKQLDTNLGKKDLGNKIQWLIELGGTDEFMKLLADELTNEHVRVCCGTTNEYNVYNESNTLFFQTDDNDVGHWTYINKNGEKMNSYNLGHQKGGSQQFCQSFALIYMLNDFGHSEYYNRFVSTINVNKKNENTILGDNIEVVLSLYYDLFTNYFDTAQQEWIIREYKEIIKKEKKMNLINDQTKEKKFQMKLIQLLQK